MLSPAKIGFEAPTLEPILYTAKIPGSWVSIVTERGALVPLSVWTVKFTVLTSGSSKGTWAFI